MCVLISACLKVSESNMFCKKENRWFSTWDCDLEVLSISVTFSPMEDDQDRLGGS